MSKVGTAHVEIKPVLNEEALAEIVRRIEAEVSAAVDRGLRGMNDRLGKAAREGALRGTGRA